MLNMIENKIPGLYYFFRGEEGLLAPTSTWGSKNALKKYGDIFKKYDRCIAFDRKKKYSVITHQMWQECCSPEFATALISEFKKSGLPYQEDDGGFWCDSGTFIEDIPECTNLSVGYDNEHTFKEYLDIEYLENLCDAVLNIEWEKLPTKRDPSIYTPTVTKTYSGGGSGSYYNYDWDNYEDDGYHSWDRYKNKPKKKKSQLSYTTNHKRQYYTANQLFQHLQDILDDLGYECLNADYFEDGMDMYFLHKKNNDHFLIKIEDFQIYMTETDTSTEYVKIGDLDAFESYVKIGGPYVDDKNISNVKTLEQEYSQHVRNIDELHSGMFIYHKTLGEGEIIILNRQQSTLSIRWMKSDTIQPNIVFDSIKANLSIEPEVDGNKIETKNIQNLADQYDVKVTDVKELEPTSYIYHTKFGEGVVTKIEGSGENSKISIYFYDDDETKILIFKYGKEFLRLALPF